MGMLSAMMDSSCASSPTSSSAGGQDEQPWLVKSSSTARGSALATSGAATSAATKNGAPHAKRGEFNLALTTRGTLGAQQRTHYSRCGESNVSVRCASGRELTQHVLQDSTVAEVIEL